MAKHKLFLYKFSSQDNTNNETVASNNTIDEPNSFDQPHDLFDVKIRV